MGTALIVLAVLVIFISYSILLWIFDPSIRSYKKGPGLRGFIEGFVDAMTNSFFERKSLSLHLRFIYGLYPLMFVLGLMLILAVASSSEAETIDAISTVSKNVFGGTISLISATFNNIVDSFSTLFS